MAAFQRKLQKLISASHTDLVMSTEPVAGLWHFKLTEDLYVLDVAHFVLMKEQTNHAVIISKPETEIRQSIFE